MASCGKPQSVRADGHQSWRVGMLLCFNNRSRTSWGHCRAVRQCCTVKWAHPLDVFGQRQGSLRTVHNVSPQTALL